MAFETFVFSTNLAWGKVDSLEEWARIVHIHTVLSGTDVDSKALMGRVSANEETVDVERGGEPPSGYLPSFGLWEDHNTDFSLKQWAEKNGMCELLGNV